MNNHTLDSTDLTWLAGLARAILGEGASADDLVQETVVAAIEGPVPEDAPRRAWLAAVARNLAARRFRGDDRRARREKRVARPEALPDSVTLVERAEIAEQVTASARSLPEPYRRAILLRFLEGLSPAEMARKDGTSADTMRWRVRRGLELLREKLVEQHDRDWSAWSALLIPLARSGGGAGLAAAGASGGLAGSVAIWTVMKLTTSLLIALLFGGIWYVWDGTPDGPGVAEKPTSIVENAALSTPSLPSDIEVIPDDRPPPSRVVEARSSETRDEPGGGSPGGIFGTVVDEQDLPVRGATIYLIPGVLDTDANEGAKRPNLLARTLADSEGRFEIETPSSVTEEMRNGPGLDLGVVANGYLRRVVSNVLRETPAEGWRVVLERGRGLSGRVVDSTGRGVSGLEVLAHSGGASIKHVSPSQMSLRASRASLGDRSSSYHQCRATTDQDGTVVFSGLSADEIFVRSLDAGWTIEEPESVGADDSRAVWVAGRRLGVRLTVVDSETSVPVEKAYATFRMKLTFADGEAEDYGKWVGRGVGEASFVLDPETLPPIRDRVITRAEFYGTVRAAIGENATGPAPVDWKADPLEDPEGVSGVVAVRVELDSGAAPVAPGVVAATEVEEPPKTHADLLVRYDDDSPVQSELVVYWSSDTANGLSRLGKARAEPRSPGRYRVEVTAGQVGFRVSEANASGSLYAWEGALQCDVGSDALLMVTIPRGAGVRVRRPSGWTGEWFVHASWRELGDTDWFGSWNYSTDEASLDLDALQPAEWRFQLRRGSENAPDPIVRTVVLTPGIRTVVDP